MRHYGMKASKAYSMPSLQALLKEKQIKAFLSSARLAILLVDKGIDAF
jgi:hypothetical protein